MLLALTKLFHEHHLLLDYKKKKRKWIQICCYALGATLLRFYKDCARTPQFVCSLDEHMDFESEFCDVYSI